MVALRRMKAEAALLIALCDIGDVWPVMRVTQALTDIAFTAVQLALRFQLRQEAARGKIVPPCTERPEEGSGLVVLAMGKMGAGELNYSSDIDLIVFFDLDAPTLAPDIEPQPFFVRVTQGMARMLNSRTADGYVFRVDLRLRPDPASTQVAISTAAAMNYYEREGRTWERAAMIKASPCAGDAVAGEALIAEIAPFVWRRHLDFAALDRRPRHEAADADVSRPDRDRGRRPQRQGRPRRHSRDRVLRPDPAIDRRRPSSRIAGAADAGRARIFSPPATGSPTRPATNSRSPICSCVASSTGCR